ncbi:MAG: S24 family peptidase [Proteiniphilum sp.]|jgi:repressor LexA
MKTGRPKIEGLTMRQSETMQEICRYFDLYDSMPSMQEIGDRFNITAPSVYLLVRALSEKGYLRKIEGGRNSYEIVRRINDNAIVLEDVPLRGTIPCGQPIEPMDVYQGETVKVDKALVQGGEYFALTLSGTSMCAMDYESGDVVIIRHQAMAQNGEIVAFCLNGEATLKRLIYTPERIALKWENGKRQVTEINSMDHFFIIGKVVKHIKKKDIIYGTK